MRAPIRTTLLCALLPAVALAQEPLFTSQPAAPLEQPRADPPDAPAAASPRLVLSLQLPALLAAGLDVQAERYLGDAAWSVAAGAGVRLPGSGDFRALHLSVGAEVRRWLWRGGWLASLADTPLGGAFVALRTDVGWTRLTRQDGTALPAAVRLTPSARAGYRLLPVWRLEVTPSVGLGATTTFGTSPGERPFTRLHVALGLTAGWVL